MQFVKLLYIKWLNMFYIIFELFVDLITFDSVSWMFEKQSSFIAREVLSCIAADLWYKQIRISISGRVGVKDFGTYTFNNKTTLITP